MKLKTTAICKRVLTMMLVFVMVVTSVNFPTMTVQAAKKSAQSVTLNHSDYTLKKGKKVKLKATVTGKKKKLTWSSNKPKVASVNSKGVVKGRKKGTAKITVKIKGTNKKASCKIRVGTPVAGITVSMPNVTLTEGGSHTIQYQLSPAKPTNKKVTFTSSNEAVASVTAGGVITALKSGVAQIIVAAADGSEKKAIVNVVVNEAIKPLTGIQMTPAEVKIQQNETTQLNVSAVPAGAPLPAVTYSSSNTNVATVTDKGLVTGVDLGIATITATAGNYVATCKVQVGNIATVGTVNELTAALEKEDISAVIYETSEKTSVEIPEGEYSDVQLVVNAPNATITNNAKFKKVQILGISEDTWIEKAVGNLLELLAKKTHVVVEGSDTSIQVGMGAENVDVENNGTIQDINITTQVNMSLEGTNRSEIPVSVSGSGTFISTSIQLKVDAQVDLSLKIKPGAENSTVDIKDEAVIPSISGVGVITITNQATGDIFEIVAENDATQEEDAQAETGVISGIVQDAQGNLLEGALVRLIPYSASFTQSKLEEAINAAKEINKYYETTVKADGTYETTAIPFGNYTMIISYGELKPYFQTTTVNQTIMPNGTTTLLEVTDVTGGIRGVLYNAFDAMPVPEGIALYIREGAGNVTGMIVQETTTDASGAYAFNDLVPGTYTIQVVDKRDVDEPFIRMSYTVVILADTVVEENMTISKLVQGDQLRFVLTWAKEDFENNTVPSDLDSHLTGPAGDYGKFHVYFSDMSHYQDDGKYVDLDVDDTTYEGPETTTVYKEIGGEYHFYIYDYSNQSNRDNTKLATSQAIVKVYRGTQNIATYHVPNQVGTLWDVCTYNSATNTLTAINKVYFHEGASDNVGVSPVDIAKASLQNIVNKLEKVYLGEVVAAEVAKKLEEANRMLDESEEHEEISALVSELEAYYEEVISSTNISYVSADDLRSYEIERFVQNEDTVCSQISLTTYSSTYPEDLTISLSDDDAGYEVMTSDIEGYEKVIVVSNTRTKAIERYYVKVKEYIPSFCPNSVEVEGNYISDYWDSWYDEEYVLTIEGENETLGTPVFTFANSDISYSYEALTNHESYVGKITATYKNHTQIIWVKYSRYIPRPNLKNIIASGNAFLVGEDDWVWDDETDEEYLVYYVEGTKAALDGSENYGFDRTPVDVTIIAEDSEYWDYKMTTNYLGREDTVYIDYRNTMSLLPRSGSYNNDWYSFDRIQLVGEEGNQKVLLTDYLTEEEFTYWDSIKFVGAVDSITYNVTEENGTYYMTILLDGEEIVSYPMCYEKNISGYIQYESITDGDNYIVNYYTDEYWDSALREYYDVLEIYGENESLGNLEIQNAHEEVSLTYETVEDSNRGVGKLIATYKSQTKVLWVRYYQQVRTPELESIKSSGQAYAVNGYTWEDVYDEDDEWLDEYKVYKVSGTKEVLDGTELFGFQIVPDAVTFNAVEKDAWNYELTVNYKGIETIIYINYQNDMSLLPVSGSYDNGWYSFDSIQLVGEEGNQKIILTDSLAEEKFSYWDSLEFEAKTEALSYEVVMEDDVYYLEISIDGEIVGKYPLVYEKNIDYCISDLSIEDEDNYISSCYLSEYWDSEQQKYVDCLMVYGENDTLGLNIQITGSYEDVTFTYEALEEVDENNNIVGNMTATYLSQTKVYPVKYTQQIRTPELQTITSDTDAFVMKGLYGESVYDESGTYLGYYTIYKVSGTKEVLDGTEKYGFQVIPDEVTFTEVEGNEYWNYELHVEYKGTEATIYIKYQNDITLLPTEGTYNEGYTYFDKIQLIGEDENQKILLIGNLSEEEFTYWDSMEFQSEVQSLTYEVRTDEDTYWLVVYLDGKELLTYPLVYEKSIDGYLSINGAVDGDNYIMDIKDYRSWNSELQQYVEYITIYGENESLGSDVIITNYHEEVEFTYEPLEEPKDDVVGCATAHYKNQTENYFVEYVQQVRTPELQTVVSEGQIYVVNDYRWEYDYDENGYQTVSYMVYNVSGTKEVLDGTEEYGFQIIPEEVSFTSVEDNEYWNYELQVAYKGTKTTIYINYKNDITFLPTSGVYDGYQYFDFIQLISDGTEQQLLVTDYLPEDSFTYWDSMKFYSDFDVLTYDVVVEEEVYYIIIKLNDEEIERYPVVYELDLLNLIGNLEVVDGDNTIYSCYLNEYYDSEKRAYIQALEVYGENETLGSDIQINGKDERVTFAYEALDVMDETYNVVGTMSACYGRQKLTYPVRYIQQ